MRLKHPILLLFSFVLLTGCLDDCGECFTPPTPFLFELVEETSGQNLFTMGALHSSKIEIIKSGATRPENHSFLDNEDENLIYLNSIGWQTEKVSLEIKHDDEILFTMDVDAEVVTENCCEFTRFHEIDFGDANVELANQNQVYRITLPLTE